MEFFKGIVEFFKDLSRDTLYIFKKKETKYGLTVRRMEKDLEAGFCNVVPCKFDEERIIIFSDFHRGGRLHGIFRKDRFKNNEPIYHKALDYYLDNGYRLVLLGDVEEAWGVNYKMDGISDTYSDTMEKEREFLKKGKYHRIIGNHDDIWRCPEEVERFFNNHGSEENKVKAFRSALFEEGNNNVLIIHGCQGHSFHDIGDNAAQTVVSFKYDFIPFLFNFKGKSYRIRKKMKAQERRIIKWARDKDYVVIVGHTHSIYFGSLPGTYFEENAKKEAEEKLKQPLTKKEKSKLKKEIKKYDKLLRLNREIEAEFKGAEDLRKDPATELFPAFFNVGSCCGWRDIISGIEIFEGEIRQVFWKKGATTPSILYRENLNPLFEKLG